MDGAYESYVSVFIHDGDFVVIKVGSLGHLILNSHYIDWIVLKMVTGYQKKDLNQEMFRSLFRCDRAFDCGI